MNKCRSCEKEIEEGLLHCANCQEEIIIEQFEASIEAENGLN